MPRPKLKENPNQKLFFFARELEDVYEEEALEGVIRVHQKMLELALNDFKSQTKIKDEWLEWLLEDDLDHPLSFAYCCEELGLDREIIRTRTANYLYRYGSLTEEQKRKIEREVF